MKVDIKQLGKHPTLFLLLWDLPVAIQSQNFLMISEILIL